MKLDWKFYSAAVGFAILFLLLFFLEKVFFFLLIVLATVLVAVIIVFFQPIKLIGIELVTLSTILVGVVYGPVMGGVYGFTLIITHLIIGRYRIGPYLIWVVPEYILIGIFSGIFGNIIGILGLVFIVGLNSINLILTALVERENFGKHLPYALGNTIINLALFLQFFQKIVNLIT